MSKTTEKQLTTIFSEILYADKELNRDNIEDAKFEIIKQGTFSDPRYGTFKVGRKLFNELKENFDNNVLEIDVAVDRNHDSFNGAFAWVATLEIKGNSLFMSLKDVTDEGMDMLVSKKFKYFSIEFGPYERPRKNKQKGDADLETFSNVLRGVAMTNRPVIKGMKDKPSFFSESISNNLSFNTKDMDLFKKLLAALLSEVSVTKKQFSMLETAYSSLSEDEQADAKADLDKVEEKVEEENAGDAGADEEEKKELSEIVALQDAKLAEQGKQLAALQADATKRESEKRLSEIMLSNSNPMGFPAKSKDLATEFASSLDEKQFSQFKKLLSEYKNLSDKVSVPSYQDSSDTDGKTLSITFDAEVAKYQKENGSTYSDAIVAVRKANPEFRKLQ